MTKYNTSDIVDLIGRIQAFKEEFAEALLDRVKQLTPVRTGLLQSSWEAEVADDMITIGNPVYYAEYVEYGTPVMAPRAMLQTTVAEAEQIADNILKDLD